MDGFSNLKDSDEDHKGGSVEALRRSRSARASLTNRHRRIRMQVDLGRRPEVEKEKPKIQKRSKIPKAAIEFGTEFAEASRFPEFVDDLGSTVKDHDVCLLLCKYEKRALAVFYLVLEAASFLLDLFGKNKRRILLSAFLLSVFGFSVSIYTCIKRRRRAATRAYCLKQLVRTVEIAFSVVQLVVTLIYFILAELGIKNNFSASVFPLVFSIIVAVFTFKYREEVSDSSGPTDDNLSGDLHVTNIQLTQAIPSKSKTVENFNPVRDLNMTHLLPSPVAPADDHQLNWQCQLPNFQEKMLELREQSIAEGSELRSETEICKEVLDRSLGYVKCLEFGPLPRSHTSFRQTTTELQQKIEHQNEEGQRTQLQNQSENLNSE